MVAACCYQVARVRGEDGVPHPLLMLAEGLGKGPVRHVPDARCPVAAGCDQTFAVGAQLSFDAIPSLVREEPCHLGVGVGGRPNEDLRRLVGCDKMGGIGGDGDGPDWDGAVRDEFLDASNRRGWRGGDGR